jgi:hypothetical protein
MRLVVVALVSFIVSLMTMDASLKNGYISNFLDNYTQTNGQTMNTQTFNCVYSSLHCACYSNNGGGCSVGCSPQRYFSLYNQTSCPQLKNFMLSGFSLS